jgi:DNA-binding XRE family transcriptional regulator
MFGVRLQKNQRGNPMTDGNPDGRTPPKEETGNRQNWRSAYITDLFKLRRRREELGMTQALVAAKIGMPLRSFQRKEAGDAEFKATELYQLV